MPALDADARRRTARELVSRLIHELALDSLQAPTAVLKDGATRDLITEYDRQIERQLADGILAKYPEDGIVGEEGTMHASSSGVTWVIDPVDGTTNLAAGSPFWAISIAVLVDGVAIAAVVNAPALHLAFSATAGVGAWLGDQRMTTTSGRVAGGLADAVVATGLSATPSLRPAQTDAFSKLASLALDVRVHGAAALELCFVASGRQHAYAESGLHSWDVAAGALIATEAGAVVSGDPLDDGGRFLIAACSDALAIAIRAAVEPDADPTAMPTSDPREIIKSRAFDGGRRIARSADVVTSAGQGSYLVTPSGSRYLDLVTAFGVASLGHSHTGLKRKLHEQFDRLTTTTFYEPVQAEYLRRLVEVLPPPLHCVGLYSGGSEAVEAALRLCQQATGRPGVVTFEGSFHGKTLAVRHAGGLVPEIGVPSPDWLRVVPDTDDSGPIAFAHLSRNRQHSAPLQPADLGIARDLHDVGCLLVEPVMGTGGNRQLPEGLLADLRELCRRQGWLLIFDESITGFGRTGERFAADLYDVVPDVLVAGKGIAGGLPLSCVAASARLWAMAGLDKSSTAATSYGGNPLSCAAGIAILDALREENLLGNVRTTGAHLLDGLLQLESLGAPIANSRGVGLMIGFDWVAPSGALADAATCKARFQQLLEAGVLIAADVPRVRLSPPLNLSTSEADQFLDAMNSIRS
jgi:4-aminobutyrate aminotransferase-like enzyme/fructose-1,6-bisphosphatase/inositol monophosphatase family enzyme